MHFSQAEVPASGAGEVVELGVWRALMAAADRAPPWLAADNGFTSVTGMARAHAPLVAATSKVAAGRPSGVVVDLGCGNGALLAAICGRVPTLRPIGVERAAERLERARLLLPGSLPHWYHGDLFTYAKAWRADVRVDIVLLMLGRLLEVPFEQAEALRQILRNNAAVVLGYAYSDWLARYRDLNALGQQAGAVSMEYPGEDHGVALVRF
jgi:SAM-dependent methyltransferase